MSITSYTSSSSSTTSASDGGGGTTAVSIPTIPDGAVLTGITVNGVVQGGGQTSVQLSGSGQGYTVGETGTFDSSNPFGTTSQALSVATDPSLLGGTAILNTGGANGSYSNLEVTVSYTFPVFNTVFYVPAAPVPVQSSPQAAVISSGNLIISAIGLLRLTSSLYAADTKGFAYEDLTVIPPGDTHYLEFVNSSNIAGAMEFLYNASLEAVKGSPHVVDNQTSFSSTYSLTSPWQNSWTINAGNGILADDEINNFGFSYLAADFNNPNPVWQRKLSDKTCYELVAGSLNQVEKFKFDNSVRVYTLEVTNSKVDVSTTLGDSSYPYAWTTAYSPSFVIPSSLVPYIIKEDSIQASYAQAQYTNTSYPPKAYSAKVLASVFTAGIISTDSTGSITATGTATLIPPLSSASISSLANWASSGSGTFIAGKVNPYLGVRVPDGIHLYRDINTSAIWIDSNSIPYFGVDGENIAIGASGDLVSFVQDALNRIYQNGFWNGNSTSPQSFSGPLQVNGIFDPQTSAVIQGFLANYGYPSVSFTTLAPELLSLIGGQVLRLGNPFPNPTTQWQRYYGYPFKNMNPLSISDGNADSYFALKPLSGSFSSPGLVVPSSGYGGGVNEVFYISLSSQEFIYGARIIPYVPEGVTAYMQGVVRVLNSLEDSPFEDIPITQDGFSGTLDPIGGPGASIPYQQIFDQQPIDVQFNAYEGSIVAVAVVFYVPGFSPVGVRDIGIFSQLTNSLNVNNEIPISFTSDVTLGFPQASIQAQPNFSGLGSLANVTWTDITTTNSSIIATITPSGLIALTLDSYSGEATEGPVLPGPGLTYYGMDLNKNINPVSETGWVTKAEGIKLLCDQFGNPVGFPLVPTTTINQGQNFASIYLFTAGNDATVKMGFYDLNQKSFISNLNGDPEMTFQDYLNRGANNVYIGVVSGYELSTVENIPVGGDAAILPHRWAMPVYSVVQKGSTISLDSLPPNLGVDDFWPVPLRVGRFSRSVFIPTTSDNNLTNYLTHYQGSLLQAFYSLPEAEDGPWSDVFGIPYTDIVGEEPLITSANSLQVRQPPILEAKQPTSNPGHADPVMPVLRVYKRPTISSPWNLLPWSDIRDFNISTGEVFLTENLTEFDPRLFKVDYTTGRHSYQYKGINLNPYLSYAVPFIDVPIFIYIEPTYVLTNGQVIPESIRSKTISFTTDPSIFDPISPAYDPLALRIGVIYISSALDVSKVGVIDSRRRGGGIKDSLTALQLSQVVALSSNNSEFLGYWDINSAEGEGYQAAGFVIIRLPASIKTLFSLAELKAIIARNITAGVSFKLEDLEGNDW